MNRRTLINFIILILIMIIPIWALITLRLTDAPINYDIVEVEGMTCIRTFGDQLTCNWEEWGRDSE